MVNISEDRIQEIFQNVSSRLPPRIPLSTYRLQFNKSFTFKDAMKIIPYLDDLGITDIYASPFFKARRDSMHGYDIVDPQSLNPEIGSEQDFEDFVAELKKHDMGLILDVVPNHMSIADEENVWWMDVLENGPSSPFAAYFDIDWKPVKETLEDKVIIPILGDFYGRVLENQQLQLSFHAGSFFIGYYGHRLPVNPSTYTKILEYRLPVLEEELGSESPDFKEMLSIITALTHLPDSTERDPRLTSERHREKEIIKGRLLRIYEECGKCRIFIDNNVKNFNGTKDVRESFDLLDELLSAQVYRLAFWRVATEEINYRRFFDINDLAAIRTEDPVVFGKTHSLALEMIRSGKVTGLRIDHPDGLYNPNDYFRRLQEECFIKLCSMHIDHDDDLAEKAFRRLYRERLQEDEGLRKPFYMVGEKILMSNERLPEDWPVFGTIGYSFMNAVSAVYVNPLSEKDIDSIYLRFTRKKYSFSDLLYEKKKLIMESSMAGEINVLGHRLNRISESHRDYRDFTLNSLTDVIVEVIASFPVYRTYVDARGAHERDLRYISIAVSRAKSRRRDLSPSIFDFLKNVLSAQYPDKLDEEHKKEWLEFAMKFQQITGPVMAKGLEDTVFYNFNRLVSLNEVGGDPSKFGISVEAFHGQNIDISKRLPYTLRATSTHDSKRSEDVRARINLISELSGEWRNGLKRWSTINKKLKKKLDSQFVPDRNEEYFLYQTMVGSWPTGEPSETDIGSFTKRIKDYMTKALREAKVNSNWLNPDMEYESAVMDFVENVMKAGQFRTDFERFQKRASRFGMLNSLAQALLKTTSPGVPDFYQGTELWHLHLVDPDNRLPVDYSVMVGLLDEIKDSEERRGLLTLTSELLENREDGKIKMYLTYKALNFRKANKTLFMEGKYLPISSEGKKSSHVIAFGRSRDSSYAITVVPRLVTSIMDDESSMPTGNVWEDTLLLLPQELAGKTCRNIFTGENLKTEVKNERVVLPMSEVLARFPVALLEVII